MGPLGDVTCTGRDVPEARGSAVEALRALVAVEPGPTLAALTSITPPRHEASFGEVARTRFLSTRVVVVIQTLGGPCRANGLYGPT